MLNGRIIRENEGKLRMEYDGRPERLIIQKNMEVLALLIRLVKNACLSANRDSFSPEISIFTYWESNSQYVNDAQTRYSTAG